MGEEHRRIGCAITDVLVGAHFEQAFKASRIAHRAKLRYVGRAVGGELRTQRISHAHLHDRGAKQIRASRYDPPDKNTPGACAVGGQKFRRGVPLGNQILGTSDTVLPGVGF